MGQDKNNLNKLLKFIRELIQQEGNEWFHDELALMVTKSMISEKDNGILFGGVTIKEIGSIEKYIGSEIAPMIDYSSISNDRVRLQLQRDCLEMGKIRLGKMRESISFKDFCKYAHFQAEELINYFYISKCDNSIGRVQNLISQNNPKFNKSTYPSIGAISYISKLWAARNILKISNNTFYTLQNAAKLRNEVSHRATLDSKKPVDSYIKFRHDENHRFIYVALNNLKNKIEANI